LFIGNTHQLRFMESSVFLSDLLMGHEPVMWDDAQIIATADRGSLSPQRGEGSRVRGEIAQVVGNQHTHFEVHGKPVFPPG
jgi:hypothetical protein